MKVRFSESVINICNVLRLHGKQQEIDAEGASSL